MPSNFVQDFEFLLDDHIKVSKYKSSKTRISVVVAEVPGPIVNGYLCLSTEAHDDDGLPHTLEHLVFMGSEDYPYKGVLDLLANRCLASGTNAWTDTDNTSYTMTTAGSEGFLNLLPIYLDHVLYPTLIPSSYVTEVHHINGEGEDAGVVYCEMQARENTGESRTHLEMLREMYPGRCGYKSETGGILKNLRESTSHQKVKDYHKTYYRPDNLCIIIVGRVSPADVFAAIAPFEDKVVAKGKLPPFERPWTSPVPPLIDPVEKVVNYGADDEDHGMVTVAWRGPKSTQLYEMTAIDILLEYLTDTAVSPLQREFVEKHPPLANHVSYSIIESSEGVVYLHFSNVPTEKEEEIRPKLTKILSDVADANKPEFDLLRMRNQVHRKITRVLNAFEDDPHEHVAGIIIGFFLYGNDSSELERRLNDVAMMRQMETEPASFWQKLLRDFLLSRSSVTILGKPSKKLMEKMGAEEKARVERQRKKLGEDGLALKKEELEEAVEQNEEEPPTEMLESVPIPSVDSIQFHSLQQRRNFGPRHGDAATDALDTLVEFRLEEIPFAFQLDSIKSKFVSFSAIVDTKDIEPRLKFYLPLFLNLVFETNLSRDGGKTVIPHTTVIADLSRDTVHYGGSLGFSGYDFAPGEFPDLAIVSLKVEEAKFVVGVNWLKDLLFHLHFNEERVKTVATKLINEVPTAKRKGTAVLRAITRNLTFTQKSNHWFTSFMRQHVFLKEVLEKIESEKSGSVLNDLKRLADVFSNDVIVHFAGDVQRLAKVLPTEDLPLTKHFAKDWPTSSVGFERATVVPTSKRLKPFNAEAQNEPARINNAIMGVGSVESSYSATSTASLVTHDHPDLAPLMVIIQYLTQLEGPMWRQIRGQGLAYHYSISVNVEQGLLYFNLHKSTHLANAYKEAKLITESLLSGDEEVDETEFEAAKSSLVFEVIEEEKTVSDAAEESILTYFRGVPHTYNKRLLSLISEVTVEDVLAVGKRLLSPLFDPAQTRTAVVCHPTKVEDIQKDFEEMKIRLHPLGSLEHDLLSSVNLVDCSCT